MSHFELISTPKIPNFHRPLLSLIFSTDSKMDKKKSLPHFAKEKVLFPPPSSARGMSVRPAIVFQLATTAFTRMGVRENKIQCSLGITLVRLKPFLHLIVSLPRGELRYF